MLLRSDQVSACEPDALLKGALLVHTIKKCMVNGAVGAIHHAQDLRGLNQKLIAVKLADLTLKATR